MNLLRCCCEKGLSAPGVGISTLTSCNQASAATARPNACEGEVLGCISDFCSVENLSRVLPNLRSNGKVSFDGRAGGGQDM